MRPTLQLFRHWARYRDDTLTREQFLSELRLIRQTTDSLLLRGEFSGNPQMNGMCKPLYDHRSRL